MAERVMLLSNSPSPDKALFLLPAEPPPFWRHHRKRTSGRPEWEDEAGEDEEGRGEYSELTKQCENREGGEKDKERKGVRHACGKDQISG